MSNFVYEDELPGNISQKQYDKWFDKSWVDGVRVGPKLEHEISKGCWCEPYLYYKHPETGNEVWVHRELQ